MQWLRCFVLSLMPMNATSKKFIETKHLKTEVDVQKLGASKAEVSFVGRSNVGKSSLINAICQKRDMAHASQVPGKTRTINVYEVTRGHWIVDLPGYGFAVGLNNEKDALGKIIEGYLNGRDSLCMVFVIIDAVAGPTKLDLMMISWLKHYSFEFSIIVSKIDKIPSPKLETQKKDIAQTLDVRNSSIFWVSSKKNIGIIELQKVVGQLLEI